MFKCSRETLKVIRRERRQCKKNRKRDKQTDRQTKTKTERDVQINMDRDGKKTTLFMSV